MHNNTRASIPGTTYRLLETTPYPRTERQGRLADASGTRLHGTYERKVAGGYQSALINNGSVLARYVYGRPAPATFPGGRHSYANLVLCGGYSWGVPDDSPRPVTDYPLAEYPHSLHRLLWDSHFVVQRLLANLKPAGSVSGTPDQVAAWCAQAEAAGLITRTLASWRGGLGEMIAHADIAHRGPVLIGNERQDLYDSYHGLVPDDMLNSALEELAGLTGEDLLCMDLANPRDTACPSLDANGYWASFWYPSRALIITGHAYGYPPMTTVACIFGTHA